LGAGVSLGVWLSLNQNTFRNNSERILIRHGARFGSATHRYCEQLLTIVKVHWDIVQTYITTMSAHGIRKGSATHVASATTAPPPTASIANWGDWSLGKVLDVYWQFAEAGDTYLGRCLCGLDPNHSTFSVLPPHWTVDNPVEDADIGEGLHLMYGVIIEKHPTSIVVLVWALASVTYASNWLLETSARHRGHPFDAIPLLRNQHLLLRLKVKVTIEPTELMAKATGVPPHVMQMNLMTSLIELCRTTLLRVNEQAKMVRQTINDALEQRVLENGQISRHQIVTILDEFRTGIRDDVRQQIDWIQAHPGLVRPQDPHNGAGAERIGAGNQGSTLYLHSGCFWDVPESFSFPAGIKLDIGWKLWLAGMPAYRTEGENGSVLNNAIKTFREFLPARLPKKIADIYKLHWRPVYVMMEEGVGDEIPEHLTTAIVNNPFERGTENLFQNEKLHHHDRVIATWARYVSQSMIMQRGTEQDKSNLPAPTHFNRPRPAGQKRRGPNQQNVVAAEQPAQRQRRPGPHSAQLLEEAVSSTEVVFFRRDLREQEI
jgi:hypothetical protein